MKRRTARGYTLVETLVAIGIITMAVAAASQLSLSMALQDEVNQFRARALNYAENNARLWQLDVAPSTVLLSEPDSVGSAITNMNAVFGSQSTVGYGEDYGVNAGTVERITVTVNYTPPGKGSTTPVALTALRPLAIHR